MAPRVSIDNNVTSDNIDDKQKNKKPMKDLINCP